MVRVVLHPLHPPALDTVLSGLPGVQLLQPLDDEGVARELAAGAEVLVTYTWRDDFLTPSLRWIAGIGAGSEQYPFGRLAAQGVVLTTGHGANAITVAEHAFALLLACTRQLGRAVRNMTERRWEQPVGAEELSGKRMLVVGLGRIGEEVARRAIAWDMPVAGIKRDPASYQGCVPDVAGPDRLGELCEWADVVVVTVPASAETEHLIGRAELERLGAGWLINVGRGKVVDEAALIEALTSGKLRGAGLDVVESEPLPDSSPLWDLPDVVLSAHTAGGSPAVGPRWGRIFQDNLRAFSGEGPWHNRADLLFEGAGTR